MGGSCASQTAPLGTRVAWYPPFTWTGYGMGSPPSLYRARITWRDLLPGVACILPMEGHGVARPLGRIEMTACGLPLLSVRPPGGRRVEVRILAQPHVATQRLRHAHMNRTMAGRPASASALEARGPVPGYAAHAGTAGDPTLAHPSIGHGTAPRAFTRRPVTVVRGPQNRGTGHSGLLSCSNVRFRFFRM